MDSSYEKYKRDMKAFVREMYSKNPAWLNSREGRKIQEVRRIKVDEAKDRLKLSLAERRTEIYELGLGEKNYPALLQMFHLKSSSNSIRLQNWGGSQTW